jgi:hypothetical protein
MRNFSFLVLACLGFVFIMLGGFLIIYGVLRNNELAIYISLGIIIGAVLYYIILGIIFVATYLKKRR